MRTLALNQQAFNSGTFYHGARGEGWRAWEGILRAKNTESGTATVILRSAVTGENVAQLNLLGPEGESTDVFIIPQAYTLDIEENTAPVNVTVVLDGDTGNSVGNRDVAGGFDNGFDQGFG